MKQGITILKGSMAAFLLLFLPFVVFTLMTSKSDTLFGIRSFVVVSGSMQPTLPVGSVIFTQKNATYQVGDIISYLKGDETVTHRIVSREKINNGFFYKTRGDANNTPDSESVSQRSVLGKNVFQLPLLGRFVFFLKTLPGFLLFVILPGSLILASEAKTLKKEIEKEVEKKLLRKMQAV